MNGVDDDRMETEFTLPAASQNDKVKDSNPIFVNTSEMHNITVPETFRFLPTNPLSKFMQRMQKHRLAILIKGPTHTGKSEIKNQLINAFAELGMTVANMDWEHGGLENKDTRESVDRNIRPELRSLVNTTGEIPSSFETLIEWVKPYDVVVMDSFNKFMDRSGRNAKSFDEMRMALNDKILVGVFQLRDDKKTRGGSASNFDAPIIITTGRDGWEFSDMWSELEKSRGNKLGLRYYPNTREILTPEELEEEKD